MSDLALYKKNTLHFEQGSPEWFQIRLGKVTASRFSDVLAKGSGATRKSYMYQIIAERLSVEVQESFTNAAMQRGIELEPEAREHYENKNLQAVEQVGFVVHDDWTGVSPDGFVGDDGLIEIKCPNSTTHIGYIIRNVFPSTYKAQVQGQLWVTGRQWCDFVSYDPRIPQNPMFTVRVERDEEYIKELQTAITIFIAETQMLIKKITGTPF